MLSPNWLAQTIFFYIFVCRTPSFTNRNIKMFCTMVASHDIITPWSLLLLRLKLIYMTETSRVIRLFCSSFFPFFLLYRCAWYIYYGFFFSSECSLSWSLHLVIQVVHHSRLIAVTWAFTLTQTICEISYHCISKDTHCHQGYQPYTESLLKFHQKNIWKYRNKCTEHVQAHWLYSILSTNHCYYVY